MAISSREFEQAMAEALRSFNAGRAAESEAACRRLLLQDPRNPAVHQLLAVLSMSRQDPAAARSHVIQSLAGRPQHGPTLLLAGKIARAAADFTTAMHFFERAATFMPDAAEAHFYLATAMYAQGLAEESIPVFRRACALEPSVMETVFNLGLALFKTGRAEEARRAFEQAIAIDPAFADAWFNLGLAHQDLGDLEGAAAAFRAALKQRPDYAEAAVNLGIVLQDARRMDDAMQAYRTAIRLRPGAFGQIAHALTGGSTGQLWLSADHLRRALSGTSGQAAISAA